MLIFIHAIAFKSSNLKSLHNNIIGFVGLLPPTNIRTTVLTPRSVEVTWTVSSSSSATGYIISYTTTASYSSGGSERINSRTTTRGTLTNLEEGTTYTITVQSTTSGNRMSANSNAVSVTTYTDGK